ncbi:DUF5590 domain-containing protein [Planococcus sp. N028]|uniref:DUF5590 domain-containing protein n=1 Tax=Planococcus shixiaomingii TaxID=3058393 RepID=A0ABT8N0J8_9BACL|nr:MULTISPECIES: DUF5590 domain-containing protein [unclassified Planococcus (in: firmicutes)]MDN7241085.1 DUF5590 domain-containing protein [Planococcus sp. N028]WKA53338.1 DUF5590 domain-containing protein [Planococcus sp. N022]
MKQWITFILGFLSFLAVVLMIVIIVVGNKPFSAVEKQAIDRVESENLLSEIDRAYVYSNKQTSVTVIGTDAEGKAKAAFVPAENDKIETINLEDKVTAQEARGIALKEMKVKDILHTKLGMESEGPVWEIAFINEEDQLNYVYILAKDGTWWKRILNL